MFGFLSLMPYPGLPRRFTRSPSTYTTPSATSGRSSGASSRRKRCSATPRVFQIRAVAFSNFMNALRALALLPRAPVPRPSRPQPRTPPPRSSPLEPQAQGRDQSSYSLCRKLRSNRRHVLSLRPRDRKLIGGDLSFSPRARDRRRAVWSSTGDLRQVEQFLIAVRNPGDDHSLVKEEGEQTHER